MHDEPVAKTMYVRIMVTRVHGTGMTAANTQSPTPSKHPRKVLFRDSCLVKGVIYEARVGTYYRVIVMARYYGRSHGVLCKSSTGGGSVEIFRFSNSDTSTNIFLIFFLSNRYIYLVHKYISIDKHIWLFLIYYTRILPTTRYWVAAAAAAGGKNKTKFVQIINKHQTFSHLVEPI